MFSDERIASHDAVIVVVPRSPQMIWRRTCRRTLDYNCWRSDRKQAWFDLYLNISNMMSSIISKLYFLWLNSICVISQRACWIAWAIWRRRWRGSWFPWAGVFQSVFLAVMAKELFWLKFHNALRFLFLMIYIRIPLVILSGTVAWRLDRIRRVEHVVVDLIWAVRSLIRHQFSESEFQFFEQENAENDAPITP